MELGIELFGDYMDNNQKLHDVFENNQKCLSQELFANSVIDNPSEKGEDTNVRWIEWLNKYLPARYSANKAIVIDSDGNISDQIDVVIFDRMYSPPVIVTGSSNYIAAESVYAVFEVKQKITKPNI